MRIYLVNLDRRTDRLAEMTAQFASLGIVAERIPAMTPLDVTDEDRNRYCDKRNWHWMTEVELSCSLSHLKAMEAFLRTDDELALILEDDARLSAHLPKFLKDVEAHPVRYDVLRVETYLDRQRLAPDTESPIGEIGIRRAWSWCAGAAAYIISRRAAQYILDSGEFKRLVTDGAMFNPYEKLSKVLTVRHCVPGLAVQMDRLDAARSDSDLEAARQSGRKPLPVPLLQRLYRTVGGIAKTELLWGSQRQFHTVFGGARKIFVPFRAD